MLSLIQGCQTAPERTGVKGEGKCAGTWNGARNHGESKLGKMNIHLKKETASLNIRSYGQSQILTSIGIRQHEDQGSIKFDMMRRQCFRSYLDVIKFGNGTK